MKNTIGRLSIERTAELLNMSPLSVQGALINQALDIGGAWKNVGSTTYTYYVSPYKVGKLIGMSIEEVLGEDIPKLRMVFLPNKKVTFIRDDEKEHLKTAANT